MSTLKNPELVEIEVHGTTRAAFLAKATLTAGAIVGANAVVTKDVPPNHIAVGVPAVIKPKKPAGRLDPAAS